MKIEKLEQRVEILAQKVENGTGGGGAPADAYTKAQADAKFQTIAGMSGYQTTSGMSSYLTKEEAAATYMTSADEVPPITSSDGGKFLRANYYNATGTSDYSWENIPVPNDVEMTTNKVTSLSNSSTDTEYPSAKCVYDLIGDVETILATLTTPSA